MKFISIDCIFAILIGSNHKDHISGFALGTQVRTLRQRPFFYELKINHFKIKFMVTIIAIINTVIFVLLALLHLYWVLGGKWALEGAIPGAAKDVFEQRPVQMKMGTLVVLLGLLGFALTASLNYSSFGLEIPSSLIQKTTVVIGLIFLARAIGDFNYCGLFRKKMGDLFSERDKAIYTPLCLYLGLSTLLLALN